MHKIYTPTRSRCISPPQALNPIIADTRRPQPQRGHATGVILPNKGRLLNLHFASIPPFVLARLLTKSQHFTSSHRPQTSLKTATSNKAMHRTALGLLRNTSRVPSWLTNLTKNCDEQQKSVSWSWIRCLGQRMARLNLIRN